QTIAVDQVGCNIAQLANVSADQQVFDLALGFPCSVLLHPQVTMSTDVPWLQLLNSTNSGSLLIYGVDRNTGPERTGHITSQMGQVTIVQAAGGPNCVTAIAPASQAFDESGGNGTITVTAAPGCFWEAVPHGVTIVTGRSGTGNGVVTFAVGTNTFTSGRSI